MKKQIIHLLIVPIALLSVIGFSAMQGKGGHADKGQGGGDKGKKEQHLGGQESKGGSGSSGKEGKNHGNNGGHGNDNKSERIERSPGNSQPSKDKVHHEKNVGHEVGNIRDDDNQGKDKNHNLEKNGDSGKSQWKKSHKQKEVLNWAQNEGINWNFDNTNASNWKRPRDQKKVSVCHNTGNGYPVMIKVSENAVQAHMNHGDQTGNCNTNYDGWPRNYVTQRETVYNQYESTWETMSYSESLINIALKKLLGIRNTFAQVRPTLSAAEITRREALIRELQNNVNLLQNQTGATKQQLSLVSINIGL